MFEALRLGYSAAQDYSIEDQNVADLRGDALFICFWVLVTSSLSGHETDTVLTYMIYHRSPHSCKAKKL